MNCIINQWFLIMSFSSNFVTMNLEDGMGNIVTMQVSFEDAERAGYDLAFAQQLMDAAMIEETAVEPEVTEEPEAAEQPVSSRRGLSSPGRISINICCVEDAPTSFKWPHEAILLLVDTYKSYEGDLTNGKVSQKKTWEKISKVMEEIGHNVSGPQCMSKFNGKKRTFKAIWDHNSKSGNNPRSWPYFELMQSLIGERPFMQPVALASSSSSNVKIRTASESSLEENNESRKSLLPKKRIASEGLSELTAVILESRRIAEEQKNRRHAENMQKQESLLSKIDELIKKL